MREVERGRKRSREVSLSITVCGGPQVGAGQRRSAVARGQTRITQGQGGHVVK